MPLPLSVNDEIDSVALHKINSPLSPATSFIRVYVLLPLDLLLSNRSGTQKLGGMMNRRRRKANCPRWHTNTHTAHPTTPNDERNQSIHPAFPSHQFLPLPPMKLANWEMMNRRYTEKRQNSEGGRGEGGAVWNRNGKKGQIELYAVG